LKGRGGEEGYLFHSADGGALEYVSGGCATEGVAGGTTGIPSQ
jgi:hypothetical protein